MLEKIPNYRRAENEALGLLKKHGVEAPPVSLETLAHGEGLSVWRAEFEDETVSGVVDLEKKKILVNKFDPQGRQRFTIAHELGHWILHQSELENNPDLVIFYRKTLEEKETDPLEQEANCFAANLLVPAFMVDGLLSSSISNKIIADIFKVSESVILFRRKLLHAIR